MKKFLFFVALILIAGCTVDRQHELPWYNDRYWYIRVFVPDGGHIEADVACPCSGSRMVGSAYIGMYKNKSIRIEHFNTRTDITISEISKQDALRIVETFYPYKKDIYIYDLHPMFNTGRR